MTNSSYIITKDLAGLSEAMSSIQDTLSGNKTTERKKVMATLLAEECIVKLAGAALEGSDVRVSVRGTLRKTVINIRSRGEEIDFSGLISSPIDMSGDVDEMAEDTIRNLILRENSQDISYRHFRDRNIVSILVTKSENKSIIDIAYAMVLAIVTGVMLRCLCPAGVAGWISDNIYASVYTMFLNGIKMVMAPLVFFSLATTMCEFTNLKDLGRTGIKVFGWYSVTTVFAILASFGMFNLLVTKPITMDSSFLSSASVAESQANISIRDTIVNLVPDNFLAPFLNSDMLQLIVLAVIVGIAIGTMGEHAGRMKSVVVMLDSFVAKITALIIKLLPVAVFASFSSFVITMDLTSVKTVSLWVAVILSSIVVMFCIYSMLLMIMGRMGPGRFFKNYIGAILSAISTCSSTATIPVSMKCCENLHISPRVYKLSIPLGATINMDGTSIFLLASTLFLASVCGVSIPTTAYASVGMTIVLMSMAAPAVPGAQIACLTTLLTIAGVPIESMVLIIGLVSLLDPILTASNVVGDGVVTTIVARSEMKQ